MMLCVVFWYNVRARSTYINWTHCRKPTRNVWDGISFPLSLFFFLIRHFPSISRSTLFARSHTFESARNNKIKKSRFELMPWTIWAASQITVHTYIMRTMLIVPGSWGNGRRHQIRHVWQWNENRINTRITNTLAMVYSFSLRAAMAWWKADT